MTLRLPSAAAFLVLLTVAASAAAQAPALLQRPPPDFLPMIQTTQAMVEEMKAVCLQKYPELKEPIEQAHRAWVLYPVSIVVLLNGKEYVSPMVTTMRQLARSQLLRDEAQARRDCEDFQGGLNKITAGIPAGVLAPFLPTQQPQ